MTRKEMGAALGDGWKWDEAWGAWVCGCVQVFHRSDRWIVDLGMQTVQADRAPAVAHLLVAAERIAGGEAQ